MTVRFRGGVFLVWVMCCIPFSCGLVNAASPGPEVLLVQLDEFPHAKQIAFSQQEVIDHEIGLGAIQKVRGEWRFKHSERLSGNLLSYTWQIVDGFTSAEVMAELLDSVAKGEGTSELFRCKGRACGQGAQWANRVFHQRLLYGRGDSQRYRAYAIQGENDYRLVAYSAARTADRQYLHVELLRIGSAPQP
jgi:hypothetical protein